MMHSSQQIHTVQKVRRVEVLLQLVVVVVVFHSWA